MEPTLRMGAQYGSIHGSQRWLRCAERELTTDGAVVYFCSHVKQAVIAAADGVVAAIEVEKYLNHRSKAKIDWG